MGAALPRNFHNADPVKHQITVIVRVESIDKRGKVRHQWQEEVQAVNELPSELLIHELLTVAGNKIHPHPKYDEGPSCD